MSVLYCLICDTLADKKQSLVHVRSHDPRDVQRDGRIKQRSGNIGEVLPGSPSALDAFAYCSFWFLARLPASKKPGSDESTRSPRMNPIKKEGVG